MTNEEIYDFKKIIRLLTEKIYEAEQQNKKTELKSKFYFVKNNQGNVQIKEIKSEEKSISEEFSKKEIKDMPKLKELSYRYKKKDKVYEYRYRKNNINKSFSSTNKEIARQKAIDFCKQLSSIIDEGYNKKNLQFNEFAINYMENVKKGIVTPKTYSVYYNRFENYILPYFNKKNIMEIKAPMIQAMLNNVLKEGYKRTAEDCYYILKTIFQYAVDNDILNKNPINAVRIPLHERENGKALDIKTEKNFINIIKGHKYELHFIILLYTGCRPCELYTMEIIDDDFLKFQNMKQHKKTKVYKEIPITPMLKPYIKRIKEEIPLTSNTELAKIFSKLVSGYRMYDLRHTFATRCQSCGVPQEVVGRWLGHKSSVITDSVYTHFDKNFMLKESKKVDY